MIANRIGFRPYATVLAVGLFLTSTILNGSQPAHALTTIDPPGSMDTRPFGISDSGDVVGLYITADSRVHGFLLTRGVHTSIDVPGSIRTNALGVSVLRSHSHDTQALGTERGLAVVGRYDTPDNVAHGYLLRDGSMTTIDYDYAADYAGTRFTVATGVNRSGQIVGRYLREDGVFRGFMLIDGQFTPLSHPDLPDGVSIQAMGINASGDIAGYYQDAPTSFHGFQLINGVFSTIDFPGSLATGGPGAIVGINSREVVGFYRERPATLPCGCDGLKGFIFKKSTYASFDVTGAISTSLTGVNTHGDMVGFYQDRNGRRHGLVVLKRPEQ